MIESSSSEALVSGDEVKALIHWFHQDAIDYPWGDNPTPYRVWISEIMLQQTVVSAAIEHFIQWMKLFPDIMTLAKAEEQAVLKAWEGLGYYSRARNIHKGARYITDSHSGIIPGSYDELIKIPGIGDYTARAILSLAFSQAYPVLDANVRRIGQRLLALREWQVRDDKRLLIQLESLIPHDSPGVFNCALMQLGQILCRVRSPECSLCPLSKSCQTRALGLQGEIPAAKKRKIKEKESTLLLLASRGTVLLTRRNKGLGKGLWFIPSVPKGTEQPLLEALTEGTAEVLTLQERVHLYTTWKERLFPFLVVLKDVSRDIPSWVLSHENDDAAWIQVSELDSYPTPSVYRKILEEIPPLF
jgi:A/G-specific adenine glycosylase